MALACTCAAGTAFGAGGSFRILHHEALEIAAEKRAGAREQVSFEAYGRRFDLELEPNERVLRALGKRTGATPLRGTVEGATKSWVRLTRSGNGRWHGMFSDGVDVYAVEPAADVSEALVQPADARGSVIFRLSDAVLPTGAAHCGTVMQGDQPTALEALESMGAEAGAAQTAAGATADGASASPTKRLLVGVVADSEFARFFDGQGTGAEQAIVQRMNIVDGIFSSQLGVRIELAAPTVFRAANDPFTRSNANELLDELRRYRAGSSQEMSRGITHLMTGRDMDGETVGIAYLGSVCGGGAASSLSEGTRSTTSAALIAAHEIGHNFNAPHDGDAGRACAATPQTFLMAPRLNGSQQFSSCSVQEMSPLATSGWCMADVGPSDTTTVPDPAAPPNPGGGGDSSGGPGSSPPTEEGGGGPMGLAALAMLAGCGLAARSRLGRSKTV